MTLTQIANCQTEQEARVIANNYAAANNYSVNEMFEMISNAWFSLMAEIHANGKSGDYKTAGLYSAAKQALSIWA